MYTIAYTSNTGFTAQYARALAKRLAVPCHELQSLPNTPEQQLIYFGWLRAGAVVGFAQAAQKGRVAALCGVGMTDPDGGMEELLRERHHLPEETPAFYMQGGIDYHKLRGFSKIIVRGVAFTVTRNLGKKKALTAAERDTLSLLHNGGDRVNLDALLPVEEWVRQNPCPAPAGVQPEAAQ